MKCGLLVFLFPIVIQCASNNESVAFFGNLSPEAKAGFRALLLGEGIRKRVNATTEEVKIRHQDQWITMTIEECQGPVIASEFSVTLDSDADDEKSDDASVATAEEEVDCDKTTEKNDEVSEGRVSGSESEDDPTLESDNKVQLNTIKLFCHSIAFCSLCLGLSVWWNR